MKTDVYNIVTERIISLLESGTIPWKKTWRGGDSPCNFVSKKKYRGINSLLLSATEFSSPYWLTFQQAKTLGGYIRKGEKSELVIFWKFFEGDGKSSESNTGIESNVENKLKTRPPLLRYYRVFNIEQTGDLEKHLPEETTDNPFTPIETASRIIEEMPRRPRIEHKEQSAYYSPVMDYVNLPRPETFVTPDDYYAVAFHELTHSTGHESRLNRERVAGKQLASFGSADYSKEELIAEMGSAFLCAEAGINTTIENSTSYLKGWLNVLKGDSRFIVSAASAAQRAVDFILNRNSLISEDESDDEVE